MHMDVGDSFSREIRANFKTDGDLRPTPKSICFLISYEEIVSKTGIFVEKMSNLPIFYQMINVFKGKIHHFFSVF